MSTTVTWLWVITTSEEQKYMIYVALKNKKSSFPYLSLSQMAIVEEISKSKILYWYG